MEDRIEITKRFNDYGSGKALKRQIGEVLTVGVDVTKERAEELVNHPSRIARYINTAVANAPEKEEISEVSEPTPIETPVETKVESLEPPLKAPKQVKQPVKAKRKTYGANKKTKK